MIYHKLYVAFDIVGNPYAVSPDKDDFNYHDPERVKEYVSKAVVDCFVDSKIEMMLEINDLKGIIAGLQDVAAGRVRPLEEIEKDLEKL